MAGLLNRKATKALIIKRAKVVRPGWNCQRVSAKALNQIEAFLRTKVDDALQAHPSIGKTFSNFF